LGRRPWGAAPVAGVIALETVEAFSFTRNDGLRRLLDVLFTLAFIYVFFARVAGLMWGRCRFGHPLARGVSHRSVASARQFELPLAAVRLSLHRLGCRRGEGDD